MNKVLNPQPTAENPYIVEDYPYGFTLRTQMRVWVEIRDGFGMRYVTQTLNPKNNIWNKPKAGTYSPIILVYQDETDGHIHPKAFSAYSEQEFNEFVEFGGEVLNQPVYAKRINAFKNYLEKRKAAGPRTMTATITTIDTNGKVESVETKQYIVE